MLTSLIQLTASLTIGSMGRGISADVDWTHFRWAIDQKMPISKSLSEFQQNLNLRIQDFKKENKVENGDLAPNVIKITNSNWYLISMGYYPSEGSTFVARPVGKTYLVEEVVQFGEFRAQQAVIDHDNLILAGQEYFVSNAKHPAAVTYRHWAKWTISNVQVANFEGRVSPFIRQGKSWTSYASGRTYPNHLEVSHGGADVQMDRTFKEVNGDLVTSTNNVLPCEMATMDDLVGAVQAKKWAQVRSFCANSTLAKELQRSCRKTPTVQWQVMRGNYGKSLSCRIPGTERMITVERVGPGWKLTKIEPAKYH